MDKKCSKYEGLFIFSDSETLQKHIQECDECRAEDEKMNKVSGLIDEVKFYYRQKAKRIMKIKAACAIFLLVGFSLTCGILTMDTDLTDALMYGDTLSAEDLGFPVDSYGLLMVGEE